MSPRKGRESMEYVAHDSASGYVHVASTMRGLYQLIIHNYRFDMSTERIFTISAHGKVWGEIRVDSFNRTVAIDTTDGREWYEWDSNRYYKEVYGL